MRADRVPVLEERRTTAAASAQTRHAEGGSAEHAGDGGHFQLRVVAQFRDEDILLYYAKSGQSSWVGILVGTDALSLMTHGTGGEEVQLAEGIDKCLMHETGDKNDEPCRGGRWLVWMVEKRKTLGYERRKR